MVIKIIFGFFIALGLIGWLLFRYGTSDWWQYRDNRRRDFKQLTKDMNPFTKLLYWVMDFYDHTR